MRTIARSLSHAAVALAIASGCGGSSDHTEAPKLAGCPAGMARIPGRHGTGDGAYCLDREEVTVAAYADCVGKALCTAAGEGRGCNKDELRTQHHPVNCVDWEQAVAYCKAQGKRLPREDEWEQAAAGVGAVAGVCWSGALPQHGTCAEDRDGSPKTREGVVDLAGNVAEWTSSGTTDERVVCGGSWNATDAALVRGDSRRTTSSHERSPIIGFRCAKSLE